MEVLQTITPELAAIIPACQLKAVKAHLKELTAEISALKTKLEFCPKIGGTERMREHPAVLHYFCGDTHIYICEFDGKDLLFGFTVLNGDIYNAEWGYTSLSEITAITVMQLDLYFEHQTIEAALYLAYPENFKMPQSLMAV